MAAVIVIIIGIITATTRAERDLVTIRDTLDCFTSKPNAHAISKSSLLLFSDYIDEHDYLTACADACYNDNTCTTFVDQFNQLGLSRKCGTTTTTPTSITYHKGECLGPETPPQQQQQQQQQQQSNSNPPLRSPESSNPSNPSNPSQSSQPSQSQSQDSDGVDSDNNTNNDDGGGGGGGHVITRYQPLVPLVMMVSGDGGDGGTTTLSMEQVAVTYNGSSWFTRGYNGGLVGPLVRTQAGTNLHISIINHLGEEPPYNPALHNKYQTLNTTNVHTHGLHVSSAAPGDDIFIEVHPGGEYNYTYNIPANHMGGTHWYHPHHHGSTATQAGGGACGMLVVDDLEGEVPNEVASLKEVHIVIQQIDVQAHVDIERKAKGDLWKTDLDATMILLNGHEMPVIRMEKAVWYRWRTVYVSMGHRSSSKIALMMSDGSCEMQLIAKDGVYLPLAPRPITRIPYPLGGRADVLVRCQSVGVFKLNSEGKGLYNGDLAVLTVVESGVTSDDIPSFVVKRPCYLVDLMCATHEEMDTHWSIALGRYHVNHQSFVDRFTPLVGGEFDIGSIVEWDVKGMNRHPFHMHVNPYQIANITTDDPNYFKIGDWHDTLGGKGPTTLSVRSNFDTFTGKAVLHCHKLTDEDKGMMGFININGREGTMSPLARQYDPSCYIDLSRGYTYSDTLPLCGVGSGGRGRGRGGGRGGGGDGGDGGDDNNQFGHLDHLNNLHHIDHIDHIDHIIGDGDEYDDSVVGGGNDGYGVKVGGGYGGGPKGPGDSV